MAKRKIYRDYREGREGKFASEETFNRSQAQGVTCHIHEEKVDKPKLADDVAILFEYEDYEDYELVEQEYHGTGDTGRARE